MLSAALADDPGRWGELAALPASAARALEGLAETRAVAARLAPAERLVVLGRGFNHATAWEIALKLKETSYLIAEPYSWADFLHGPIAMVEPGFPVVLVSPSGALAADAADVEARLQARGAELITIADHAGATLRVPPVPEWLSPMLTVIPGQLLALELALARGLDPDRPRGLEKVTLTT
jgi:glucosamine--fructose-6-phosphate aminotransferase (isomerizing)